MKNAILILTALALIAGGCKQKTKQEQTAETPTVENERQSLSESFGQENENEEREESGDPGIAPFIAGIYRNSGDGGCRIFLNITKSIDQNNIDRYFYALLINDKQYDGNVTVSAVENYIVLEGIPWAANGNPIQKNALVHGIDAIWEDGNLTIQNYGNASNQYQKLNCDAKFITLVKEENQAETKQNRTNKKIKHYFNTFLRPHADYRKDHIGVFYDDGTVYSCYDSEGCNYEQDKKPEEREPNDRYTERPTLLYIGKLEDWDFFNDFGNIHAGWEIVNHYRVYSPLQITNLISDLSKENLSQDDNVQHIENTCLIFITPENGYEEWMWYQDDRKKEYAEKGIPSIDAKERYLSFRLFDGSQISIDVKKEQNGISPSALLYRNGYIPIIISISGESEEGMEQIENYLSESGDGGLPFERWSTF